jgi:hypothetical protein
MFGRLYYYGFYAQLTHKPQCLYVAEMFKEVCQGNQRRLLNMTIIITAYHYNFSIEGEKTKTRANYFNQR